MADDYCFEDMLVKTWNPALPRLRHKQHREESFEWMIGSFNLAHGETALWIAVIMQAMLDALSRATHSEARFYKYEALCWLTGNSRDFIEVCLLAGLEPGYVRRKAKRALSSPIRWRADPGKGKRYLERRAYRENANKPPQAAGDEDAGSNVITGLWAMA